MSFYDQYPAPKQKRGPIAPEYKLRLLEERLKKFVFVAMFLGALWYAFSTSIPGRRILYMARTGKQVPIFSNKLWP
jgi:hypothetical protein